MKMAQNILSKLQLITSVSAPEKTETMDKFEEIKKYKNLLDEGIISQEDFENKKKELLNL
ncbi:MAG: SHOCT domain-containing protein [Erysipelotrichaceae bacterium]|nr:SHOCT domain-containing protein [Erysipelotrichaceae bacterium]